MRPDDVLSFIHTHYYQLCKPQISPEVDHPHLPALRVFFLESTICARCIYVCVCVYV